MIKLFLPEQVEHRGEEQLVVDGNAHVARLVEGWGHRPDSGPQGAAPAEEQKFSCGKRKGNNKYKFNQRQLLTDGKQEVQASCAVSLI